MTETMTQEPSGLEAIKQRLTNATPGPWTIEEIERYHVGELIIKFYEIYAKDIAIAGGEFGVIERRENAEFIAHAPDDIAKLIKVAEAAQAYCDVMDQYEGTNFEYAPYKNLEKALEDL